METVGEILKKSRESRKISILEVSRELKVSIDILRNLENNYFQNDIASVYVIGHLRSYCRFLDLNHNQLINQFKKEHLPEEKPKEEIEKPIFEYKFLFSNKLISFSLIILIFGTFYFLFIEVEKPSREYAIIPDLPENYISIVEKANLDKELINKNKKIISKDNFAKKETIVNSSSVIASIPKAEENKSPIITLKFLDDTWVQLRDQNNEIIFSQLMNKNDEYSYKLNAEYSITSGNAGHILVMINQEVRGKIGKKGQVVDSLVISNDFNN